VAASTSCSPPRISLVATRDIFWPLFLIALGVWLIIRRRSLDLPLPQLLLAGRPDPRSGSSRCSSHRADPDRPPPPARRPVAGDLDRNRTRDHHPPFGARPDCEVAARSSSSFAVVGRPPTSSSHPTRRPPAPSRRSGEVGTFTEAQAGGRHRRRHDRDLRWRRPRLQAVSRSHRLLGAETRRPAGFRVAI